MICFGYMIDTNQMQKAMKRGIKDIASGIRKKNNVTEQAIIYPSRQNVNKFQKLFNKQEWEKRSV